MAGRHSPSPDWRWKLAAWMGETLRPQGGKGKFFGWEALARVRQDVMVHGVRRESLTKRGVRKVK